MTQDPKELRKMAGLKTVAEVYRALDKLSIRKEYHEALARHDLSLDFVVSGIKEIAVSGEEDAVRLNAYKTILKSLGLDEYKESDAETKNTWEEVIIQADQGAHGKPKKLAAVGEYEVIQPKIPEDILKRKAEELQVGKELYDE